MTATDTAPSVSPDTAPTQRYRGGRPRDPAKHGVIVDATVTLIAEVGIGGFTIDDIAAECRVGKATIYRRWRTADDLFVDAVLTLGVTDVPWGSGPGTVRDDLIALLLAATTGRAARAERALLSALPYRPELRAAFEAGPMARLSEAVTVGCSRAELRGDGWPENTPIDAAIALLHHDAQTTGADPDRVAVAAVVDGVVLAR